MVRARDRGSTTMTHRIDHQIDDQLDPRIDQRPDDLSDRQRAILRVIVEEHLATAAPVGSDTIVRKYAPGVSPATIRNEMAALTLAGFISNPHTSAGRVPTDRGYGYYVRRLMRPAELSPDERRMIDHLFHQIERDLDQWLQLAATVLAQLSGYASMVTLPVARHTRLRHLDLIATQDHVALLVALLQEGTLHQQLLVRSESLVQEQLDHTARRLTAELRDRPVMEVAAWSNGRTPLDVAVRDSLAHLMRRVDQPTARGIRYDGVRFLLDEPEFTRPEMAREILRAFEQRQVLVDIADAATARDGVQVLIGDENVGSALRACSVVATRYRTGGAAGVIGLIGPIRMRYDRAIAILQYLSEVMSGLWSELSG